MNNVYLLLGSNEGNRVLYISKAIVLINKYIGNVINRSSLYETEPWGYKSDNSFINIAMHVKTNLSAKKVLLNIKKIENELGRKKDNTKYSSRCIDIDIILYNNDIVKDDGLIIPHQKMHERKFVLEPLNEIATGYIHPILKKKIKELLNECKDKCKVEVFYN